MVEFCGDATQSGSSAPSSGSTQIHPNGDTSKCLDVQGGVFANGTPVQMLVSYASYGSIVVYADILSISYDCNGTPAQNWVINSGSTAVQVAGQNYCIDAGSCACLTYTGSVLTAETTLNACSSR